MMLNSKIESALNEQIGLEAYASFLYLAMASWSEREGLQGCANFLYRQSDEERAHMLRIFNYINEMDGYALTPAIAQTPHDFSTIQALFDKVYAHEQKVTSSINNLITLSYEEKDHSTLNFLQWYVQEQREEESLMRDILTKIRLIGDGAQSLYYIDKELEKINRATAAKEATEGENT
jgi:ferritin